MTPYLPLLLSLFAVDLLAAMSPGPNFVLVSQSALRSGKRYALAVVGGFVLSNLIWCVAVAAGLSSLFAIAPWLYRAARILGGAYLIYFGIQLWRAEAPAPAEIEREATTRLAVVRGMMTNLANPKSAIYFGSVFAAFLAPGTPAWVQLAAVAIVLANTLLWYAAVALLFSSRTVHRLSESARRGIDRVAGALLAAFGLRLVLVRE